MYLSIYLSLFFSLPSFHFTLSFPFFLSLYGTGSHTFSTSARFSFFSFRMFNFRFCRSLFRNGSEIFEDVYLDSEHSALNHWNVHEHGKKRKNWNASILLGYARIVIIETLGIKMVTYFGNLLDTDSGNNYHFCDDNLF